MQHNKDLVQLAKYPEFYTLKKELLDFIDRIDTVTGVETIEELKGRQYSVENIKELLINLGLLNRVDFTPKDSSYE